MINILLISVALAMDAFSISICAGASLADPGFKKPLRVAFYFAIFHVLLFFIGWQSGTWVADRIGGFDHWIAFVVLATISAKMMISFWYKTEKTILFSFKPSNLILLSVATSLDALGVGAGLAFTNYSMTWLIVAIGFTVFLFCFFGVWGGRVVVRYINNYATLGGAILLFLIGLKILFDHGVFKIFLS